MEEYSEVEQWRLFKIISSLRTMHHMAYQQQVSILNYVMFTGPEFIWTPEDRWGIEDLIKVSTMQILKLKALLILILQQMIVATLL